MLICVQYSIPIVMCQEQQTALSFSIKSKKTSAAPESN